MPRRTKMQQGKAGIDKINTRIDRLSSRYARAEALLTSLVARAVLGGTLGAPAVKRAVRSQAETMLRELDAVGIPEGEAIVEAAYQLGVRLAAKEHVIQGSIDDEALALLKENLHERLGDATTHVGRRVDDVFRKEALRLASQALALKGEPQAEVLQRRLVSQGVSAFTDRNGRDWGLESYARMAVKTTSAEAVFHATQSTLIAKGLDIVEVNRVRKPCELCKPYDGRTFSLTGRAGGLPILDVIFPIHPNCQHYIVAGRAAFDERRMARA